MNRIAIVVAAMLLALASMAAPAAAHGKEVNPPGRDEGRGPVPVSQSWAQAHCHAEAPEKATLHSDGVVVFHPAEALDCPATPNPGGQVHPHAGD